MKMLAYAMNYWSKGTMKALFLEHEVRMLIRSWSFWVVLGFFYSLISDQLKNISEHFSMSDVLHRTEKKSTHDACFEKLLEVKLHRFQLVLGLVTTVSARYAILVFSRPVQPGHPLRRCH